jgi:4-aminobutyrate aminotransferase-like enzyme
VIGRAKIMDAPAPGGLGGTYAGHPVGCAAALAVIEVIEQEKLNDRSLAIGERIVSRLKAMKAGAQGAPIGDIRHLGGMAAFELVKARGGNEPDADAAKALTSRALANGLVLLTCGVFGNGIRIMVPVTISDALLDEGLSILDKSLQEIAEVQTGARPPLAAAR